ncbi:MAG: Ig-like domain repeat protein [Candidatus Limnocylindrales bacterium]
MYLGALSCLAIGSCVAVGDYLDSSHYGQGLIETLSGGNWTATTAPLSGLSPTPRTNPEVYLEALSCPAIGSCVAVGNYTDSSGNGQGLIETLSGGNWTATTAPLSGLDPAAGANPQAALVAISCPGTGSCVAVGMYSASSVNHQGLIETLSGGNWTATTAPTSGLVPTAGTDPEVYLNALSCPATGACVAVGIYNDSSNYGQGLIETLSGGNWTATTAPLSGLSPAAATNPQVNLEALSCPGIGSCVAADNYTDSSGNVQGLIGTQHGETWTATTALTSGLSPAAGANPQVSLVALSCPGTGSCVAVGYYTDSSGNMQGLIESQSTLTVPTVTVPTVTVPGAPTGLAATAGNAQVSLSWTAPSSNGGAAITGFVVTPYVGTTVQTTQTFTSTATTEIATGLTNGTIYTFKVAAINAVGTGPNSAASNSVTPVKATSKTTLKLSAKKVTYGHEQTEHLSVTVSPQFAGSMPTGTVTVKASTRTLCVITLSSGKGSCRLSAKRLNAGTYHLVATYGGSTNFDGSTSPKETLRVVR